MLTPKEELREAKAYIERQQKEIADLRENVSAFESLRISSNKSSNIIAELMFAFINKDEDFPHSFEIEAFEEALIYLQEHYQGEKFNLRVFEDHLNEMNKLAGI